MPCDYKNYAKDWKAIRKRILARSQNRCEFCGLRQYAVGFRTPNGEFYQIRGNLYLDTMGYASCYADARECAAGANIDLAEGEGRHVVIVLTIAHLNHDVSDNRDQNLRALCQQCHLRHDGQLHAENAYRTRKAKFMASNPPLPLENA